MLVKWILFTLIIVVCIIGCVITSYICGILILSMLLCRLDLELLKVLTKAKNTATYSSSGLTRCGNTNVVLLVVVSLLLSPLQVILVVKVVLVGMVITILSVVLCMLYMLLNIIVAMVICTVVMENDI